MQAAAARHGDLARADLGHGLDLVHEVVLDAHLVLVQLDELHRLQVCRE